MTDQIISIGAIALITLVVGGLLGVLQGGRFSFGWLLVAVGLVVFNDFLLTNGYHHLPRVLPRSGWNWQGKALALGGTLVVASSPSSAAAISLTVCSAAAPSSRLTERCLPRASSRRA